MRTFLPQLLLSACTGLTPTAGSNQADDTGSTFDTSEEDTDTDDSGEGSTDTPRKPSVGDLVISELMINPGAVDDELGEWLELTSLVAHPLDLSGLVLSDLGVDTNMVTGNAILDGGAYAVLCADGGSRTNGGVSCDLTYDYATTGGGFALANSADEVIVSTADATELDRVLYGDDFAPESQSIGVGAAGLSPSGNDNTNAWCGQGGNLSGGDQGNPGAANTDC